MEDISSWKKTKTFFISSIIPNIITKKQGLRLICMVAFFSSSKVTFNQVYDTTTVQSPMANLTVQMHFCFTKVVVQDIYFFMRKTCNSKNFCIQSFTEFYLMLHCKTKPCKAYRENLVLNAGNSCSHYRVPVFITRISL